ncbi:MAG: glycosyltransferase [Kiritimatiellae bacterium]|nr:glycosyltransferase [Kiritimatiellia bacterium]
MKSLRILFVGNFLVRHWGNGRTGIDMRLAAGALRRNWQILTFSERDIARFLAPLGFLRNIGAQMMNARLVKTAKNWKPDLVFVGHCDYVTNAALEAIRAARPAVKIVHLNCDAIAQTHTRDQIARRVPVCDAIFSTTAGADLKTWTTGRNVVGYFPNPCDPSFEVEDNSTRTDFTYDLFFAGRPGKTDARSVFLQKLLTRLDPSIRQGLFGMGRPLVVGRAYEEAIAASKMGLSLNQYEAKWYASDRLSHLMGNGLVAFQYDGNEMQRFFSEQETVYFHSPDELAEKILYFNTHDAARQAVAAAGRTKYHRLFAAERVLAYLVETVFGENYSQPYEWSSEVYR